MCALAARESARALLALAHVRRGARRLSEDLRRYGRAELDRAHDDLSEDWPFFLCWSVAIAVVAIGGVQALEWLTINSEHFAVRLAGNVFALLLAGASLGVLAWIYWLIQVDSEDPKPYVVALLSSFATVGVCTAAFSGLTVTLWREEFFVTGPTSRTPDLWSVNAYYLWHLVDALPVLGVTEALHWEQPVIFTDSWSGVLLLAFKVLLLIPMVRILFSALRLFQSQWLSVFERETPSRGHWPGQVSGVAGNWTRPLLRKLHVAAMTLHVLLWLTALPLLTYGVLVLVIRQGSLVDRWLADHVPASVEVLQLSASLAWVPTALDIACAWALIGLAWSMADDLKDAYELHYLSTFSVRRTAEALALSCWLMLLATGAAVAVTLVLLHVGLARTDKPLPATHEVGATLEWYAWHIAQAMPVLEAPQTVNWAIDVEYIDPWTGTMLVVMRIALVAIPLASVALFIRLSVRQALRQRRDSGQLDALAIFTESVADAQGHLDRAQHQVLEGRRGTNSTHIREVQHLYLADRAIRSAEHQRVKVHALLGSGPVEKAGLAAVAALKERHVGLENAGRDLFLAGRNLRRIQAVQQTLRQQREVAITHRDTFDALAVEALESAAVTHRARP